MILILLSGLVDRLKESMETDDLDFGEIVETILKEAWKNDEGGNR